jgi:hypothetical protein
MRDLRFIVTAAILLSPAVLRAADPFLGRWSLDVKMSKYPVGACPKEMTIEMAKAGDRVHYHSETRLTNRSSSSADYIADYDGKPVIVIGARGMLLPVSLKRTGPNVVIATYTSGFQTVATSRRVVSADGVVMTITTTSRDGAGKAVTHVGVYQRAKSAVTSGFDLSKAKGDLLVAKSP